MFKHAKISAILSIAIVLIGIVAAIGLATAASSTTQYPYGGNMPPWVDQHSAINKIPTVIVNATLWSSPAKNPYNGNLPPWVEYNITDANPIVLRITGNVNYPLSLTMSELQKYPNIGVKKTYTSHNVVQSIDVTGASLNALLDAVQPRSGATTVRFTGSDGVSADIPLSTIRSDSNSIIAFNSPPHGTLRNILPSQSSPGKWTYDLVSVQVL